MSNVNATSSVRRAEMATASVQEPRKPALAGSFTRADRDGVGRPFRGSMMTTGLTGEQQVDPQELNLAGANVSALFRTFTEHRGAQRNEIPFTFENGETATITGTATNQNVRGRTLGGVVLEANISARGAEAVRGFRTPRELHTFLNRFVMAAGWVNARALPDRSTA